MGDRSNVFIQTQPSLDGERWSGIGIYSHWHGTALHDAALRALPKASGRIGDPSYLTRIIVHNVLHEIADVDSLTGFGLWVEYPDDNEHPILVINAMTGDHWLAGNATYRHNKE